MQLKKLCNHEFLMGEGALRPFPDLSPTGDREAQLADYLGLSWSQLFRIQAITQISIRSQAQLTTPVAPTRKNDQMSFHKLPINQTIPCGLQ